jgi:DNA-binding response OmpR family regulator
MKKKILLFEPDSFFRNTLLEHISLNRDFDVTEVGSVESVEYQSKKLPFDLIIMGTDQGENCLISVEKFIKKAKITNKMLFMIGMEPEGISSFEKRPEKHYFIEKPFRINFLNKKISTILAKISNLNEVSHEIGPFIFFPQRKIITINNITIVELTEKEVDILKCLINSGREPVDRDKLLKQVWNYSSDVTTHTLETHIYRLRQKLEIDASVPRLIISTGGGFVLRSL